MTEFCVAIESIQDNNLLAAQSNVEYDSQPLQQKLIVLAQGLRAALQTEQPLQPLLVQVSHLNQSFIQLEKYAIGGSMSRVLDGQFSLRKIIMQIKGVRDAEFIQPAYALLELFTIASTIALLLIKNETVSEGLIVSSLMFVVFLYLLLLIKDLDNPFQYRGFASVDSALSVLDETIARLAGSARIESQLSGTNESCQHGC